MEKYIYCIEKLLSFTMKNVFPEFKKSLFSFPVWEHTRRLILKYEILLHNFRYQLSRLGIICSKLRNCQICFVIRLHLGAKLSVLLVFSRHLHVTMVRTFVFPPPLYISTTLGKQGMSWDAIRIPSQIHYVNTFCRLSLYCRSYFTSA